jgi:hypothetical protein
MASYLQGNLVFAVVHGVLLLWALVVVLRAVWSTWHDRAWLRRPGGEGAGRLASLWKQLKDAGNAGRLELRELYETQTSADSDDLARIANLFLLVGVAGTLWSLVGGALAVQIKPPSSDEVGAAEALIPVLRSFNAFSVTIVSVALAFVVLLVQRWIGRWVANVGIEAANAWVDSRNGADSAFGALYAAVGELTSAIKTLGPQGSSEWARKEVDRITAELGARTREASQQMTGAAGAFASKFSEAVAPLAAQITGAVGPVVDRLQAMTTAFESSARALEAQRQVLDKHATALAVIHERLGVAEDAVQHLRDVPDVVGASLHDIGKHVTATLETLHGNFTDKLEAIFKLHEGAVLTVATRMRETESHLAAAVERGTVEVKQYLFQHGQSLTSTVDHMLTSAAGAADASVWAPVRGEVEGLTSQAQRAAASVRAVEAAALESVQQSIAALGERTRTVDGNILSLAQRATIGVTAIEGHVVQAVEAVRDSVGELGMQAREAAAQLHQMRGAIGDTSHRDDRRSPVVPHWASTVVLTAGMIVLCILVYTRLGH